MNSEELEQSLRAEFENYLKGVVAELRQGVSDFQEKINADFEKHKEQLETSFHEFNEQIGKERELELSFTDSVAEHLKLAKDEGARITATAIAEAEELREEPAPPDFSELRNAINSISEKDSQSEILKELVNYATEFTPRGAFFIVKNEHLVGWRVFGREDHDDPQVIREVFFPLDSNTALSDAVRQLSTVTETGAESEDDVMYRNRLGFENSDQMCAIPLIARGRGVAVLYADTGETGGSINVSAIESLMRVAGLTVEVLASAPPVSREHGIPESAPVHEEVPDYEDESSALAPEHEAEVEEAPSPIAAPVAETEFRSESEAPHIEKPDYEAPQFKAPEEEAPQFKAPEEAVAEVEHDEIKESEEFQFKPVDSAETEFVSSEAAPEAEGFEDLDSDFETPVPEFAEMDDSVASDEPTASFEAEEWDQPASPPASEGSDSFDGDFDEPAKAEFESYDAGSHRPVTEPEVEESSSEFAFDSSPQDSAFDEPEDVTDEFGFDSDTEVPSFEEAEVSEFDSGSEAPSNEDEEVPSFDSEASFDADEVPAFDSEASFDADEVPAFDSEASFDADEVPAFDSEASFDADEVPVFDSKASFDTGEEVPAFDSGASFDADEAPSEAPTSFDSIEHVTEEVPAKAPVAVPVESPVPSVRPRFADRNLDLPIEVGEDERRLHNDARRFARLLVSEIKLYNEQKVKEGRESNDLYERLREAIDRSREMYDKRVQPPVAAKFDYFNYELVNTLAEGDEGKLGGSYPGPAV